MKNVFADKPDCIIIYAGKNDITNGINSLNSVKKIVKNVKKKFPKHETCLLRYVTQER